jgi:putative addiction module component (TIGR02574 family)
MPETSIPNPQGFAELTRAEQLRYVQSLWDQISEHPEEIPVPESHLQLVKERLRRYRQNPASTQSAFEVNDHLLQKQK